jgi:hypothetical protein
LTAEPEEDVVESLSAYIEIEQRRIEEIAGLRDSLADEALALRKLGLRANSERVSLASSVCARIANEAAIGIVAMTRLLDAAKTVRLSISTVAAGNE